mmetsp:Transcript_42727/g.129799  ORF Transcript_42727/g.129799 Transcript_42727/m.129799 type:complete len:137 (-) Transcript_42727:631-1041(-)
MIGYLFGPGSEDGTFKGLILWYIPSTEIINMAVINWYDSPVNNIMTEPKKIACSSSTTEPTRKTGPMKFFNEPARGRPTVAAVSLLMMPSDAFKVVADAAFNCVRHLPAFAGIQAEPVAGVVARDSAVRAATEPAP